MTGFGVLLRKELREQWRTFRLPIVALIFFVIGLGSPLLAKYAPEIVERAGGNIQITVPEPTLKDPSTSSSRTWGRPGHSRQFCSPWAP